MTWVRRQITIATKKKCRSSFPRKAALPDVTSTKSDTLPYRQCSDLATHAMPVLRVSSMESTTRRSALSARSGSPSARLTTPPRPRFPHDWDQVDQDQCILSFSPDFLG